MRYAWLLFLVLASLAAPALTPAAGAQARRGLLVEAGPTVNAWGSRVGAYHFWHLSDQWLFDLGASHSLFFPRDRPAGQVTAGGHLRYLFDVLRIVPSVHVGIGFGSLADEGVPVTELEVGLSADYMLSRRVQLGLAVSGVTALYGGGGIDVGEADPVETVTRVQVLLRFQWVFGETW